jgi:hypothetical protein
MTGYTSILKNLPFILVVPVIFAIGVAFAYRLRQKSPEQYALLATDYA